MPIYEELFYLGTGRYIDFMRSSKLICAEISGQTQEIVAGNDELVREFGKGFDTTNRTLEWGFSNVADGLSEISSAIEDLRADFNYNIGLVIEQMQIQNKLITEVIEKLDTIHKTLETPLLTQAREFYRIGAERLQRGLLDKALEAFLKAEEKNDADFFTEFQLGKLYLYGIDEDDNVIDLQKAKKHLRLAIRYGKGELKVLHDFNRWAGEACFHAAIACYVQVNEPEIKENPAEVKRLLEEARNFAKESCEIYPQISEAYYHYAKFSALLGDSENTVSNLEKAVTMDRRYCIKAEIDKDFDAVRTKVIELYEKLRKDSEIKAKELLGQAKKHLSNIYVYSEDGKQVKAEAEKLIQNAEILIEKNTYFSNLDEIPYLNRAIEISSSYYEKGLWINCIPYKTLILKNFEPVIFSSDGKFLVCRSYDRSLSNLIQIWDTNDGRLLKTLEGNVLKNKFSIDRHPITFSPDGKFLAIGGEGRSNDKDLIEIWDIIDNRLIRTLEGKETNSPISLALSPDGKFLVTAGFSYYGKYDLIQIFDVNDSSWRNTPYKIERFLRDNIKGWIDNRYMIENWPIALSPDGKLLAIGGESSGNLIEIWDINNGRLWSSEGNVSDNFLIAFSPDSKLLVTSGINHSGTHDLIQIWDANNGRLIRTLVEIGDSSLKDKVSITFSSDGKFLAIGGKEILEDKEEIKIWYIIDGTLITTLLPNKEEFFDCRVVVAFSLDGRLLANTIERFSHLNKIKIWKKNT